MRIGNYIWPILLIVSFLATLVLAPTFFFSPACQSSYFERFISGTCGINGYLYGISALILLVSAFITVNNIGAGRSDFKTWGVGLLGAVFVAVAILFWFGGDSAALVLILPAIYAGYRFRRRTGIFVYRG